MTVSNVLRWFHTIRHLRPVQIYGRLWFRLHHPLIDLSPAPPARILNAKAVLTGWRGSSLLFPMVFRFLNEEHELAGVDDWDNPSVGKLWRYNLHYFDDLTAEGAETRTKCHELMLRWVDEKPPGHGMGWEPYPTSLRMVNWIRWSLAGGILSPECMQSLAVQARWLSEKLEHHLLGNHLWANAKALVFAGMFFDGSEAVRWLTVGLKLLRRELQEQVLEDGGHFERSPMYHAIVLSDLLDLVELSVIYPDALPMNDVSAWREIIPRMLYWLAVMTNPDGKIALFNDAAFGIAPRLRDLEDGAKALGIVFDNYLEGPMHNLPETGYVRLQKGPAVVIADLGEIGPDYMPGHAHADTLSFEMSLYGQRVIVDTGTSRYDVSDERMMQRGTSAHNTVQVDEEDSSEVWSSFRVARRARPFDLTVRQDHNLLIIDASHDGYKRLNGSPVHRRHWSLSDRSLLIQDIIDGSFTNAVSRFHFHPDLMVVAEDNCEAGTLRLLHGEKIIWHAKGGGKSLVTSTYHPEFGLSIPNRCLNVEFEGNICEVKFTW